jgi:hypothetical protein
LQLITQETNDHQKTFDSIADRLPDDAREKWIAAKEQILSTLRLIDADHPVVISQKARRLSFVHERILVNTEIITDVRPVYTTKGDRILDMIIQHKLVVTQHDSTHRDIDFQFVMDARDIVNLKTACERAIQKAQVLQESLANSPWVTEVLNTDDEA